MRAGLTDPFIEHALNERRLACVWFTRRDVPQTETHAAYTKLTGHLGDKLITKVIPNVVLVMSALGPAVVIKEQEDAIRNEFARAISGGRA